MPERKKVIKGLECCRWDECDGCDYKGLAECMERMLEDARALLEAQECATVEPKRPEPFRRESDGGR